jgi:hypothetical protein
LGEASGLCGKRTLPPLGTGSRVERFTQIDADWGYGVRFRDLPLVFGEDTCPYPVLLIRVNLCNLWMFLKDWIPGQARDDTVDSLGVLCFGVG